LQHCIIAHPGIHLTHQLKSAFTFPRLCAYCGRNIDGVLAYISHYAESHASSFRAFASAFLDLRAPSQPDTVSLRDDDPASVFQALIVGHPVPVCLSAASEQITVICPTVIVSFTQHHHQFVEIRSLLWKCPAVVFGGPASLGALERHGLINSAMCRLSAIFATQNPNLPPLLVHQYLRRQRFFNTRAENFRCPLCTDYCGCQRDLYLHLFLLHRGPQGRLLQLCRCEGVCALCHETVRGGDALAAHAYARHRRALLEAAALQASRDLEQWVAREMEGLANEGADAHPQAPAPYGGAPQVAPAPFVGQAQFGGGRMPFPPLFGNPADLRMPPGALLAFEGAQQPPVLLLPVPGAAPAPPPAPAPAPAQGARPGQPVLRRAPAQRPPAPDDGLGGFFL
jgi:hypothetical protein